MFVMDIKLIHGGTIQLKSVTLDLWNPVPVADVINNDVTDLTKQSHSDP